MTSSTICSHHRIRTVLLMCVVLLSASLHAQAQNKETRINLNIRNATLESFRSNWKMQPDSPSSMGKK